MCDSKMKKILPIVFILVSAFFGVSCMPQNKSVVSSTPNSSKSSNVKPVFNAAALVGKNPKEVEKILGNPTDSWIPTDRPSGSGYLIQTYALGEDMTVEFHKNRIKSLVIFFSQKDVDSETAYRLVGLDYAKPKPTGISNITTAQNWIKIFY
jgi:hypothetical protein